MFGSRCLLTKINDLDLDRRFSFADNRTRRSSTARHPEDQYLVCAVQSVGESEKEARRRGEGSGRGEQKYGR